MDEADSRLRRLQLIHRSLCDNKNWSMVEIREPAATHVRRALLVVAVIAALAVAGLLVAGYRDLEKAAQCSALYRGARSAADSGQVDAAQPTSLGGRRDAIDGVSCGTLRRLGKLR